MILCNVSFLFAEHYKIPQFQATLIELTPRPKAMENL